MKTLRTYLSSILILAASLTLAAGEPQRISLDGDWGYRKTFHVDKDIYTVSNVWLVLEGVDTYCRISVNNLPVCETGNIISSYAI